MRSENGEKVEETILFRGKPVGLAMGLLTPQLIVQRIPPAMQVVQKSYTYA